MGEYTVQQLEEKMREEYSEMMVVLESGVEYDLHYGSAHETEFDEENGIVKFDGHHDGEHVRGEFPASSVEHVYTHLEV